MRYSYCIAFPDIHPYESSDLERRWRSFLGEFVKPIAQRYPDLLFWTSYYYQAAKFRVVSDDATVHQFIGQQIQDAGLIWLTDPNFGEDDVTLVGDLGSARFVDQSLGTTQEEKEQIRARRAMLTLKFLCSTVRLHLDSLVPADQNPGSVNKHWDYQPTPEKDLNPLNNNFESLVHLVGNITRFEFEVMTATKTIYGPAQIIGTQRHRLWS